jgi:outer membrane protein assembly factor BamB
MKMKLIVITLMCLLLLAPMAAMPSVSADSSSTTAVLIDFGNGQSVWADINATSGMTAFDATIQMATNLGLVINATHFSFGWSINSINGIGDNLSSGGYNFTSGEFWGFYIWNSTSNAWDSSFVGADAVIANGIGAVAWGYLPFGVSPLPTPDHRYPWRSFRHDNFNTGLQNVIAPNNVTLKWSTDLHNGSIDASIVAANGLAYVVTSGLNLTTFVYDKNSTVCCMNSTGAVVWSQEIGVGWYQVGAPLIYDGKIIVSSANGKVYAFDAKTGADAWTEPFDMQSGLVYGNPSPIAYGGWIYVASGTGKLFALMGDGIQAWNATVASSIYSSSPAAKDGTIFIGAEDGKLHAYNSMTGAQKWNVSVGSKVRGMPLLTSSGITVSYINNTGSSPTGGIAFVSYDGHIVSYAQTGATPGSPALTGVGIVSATSTTLYLTSASGQTLWSVSLTSEGFSPGAPTAVKGTIFAVTNEVHSRLIAVSEKGQIYWQTYLDPAQYALAAPTVADGVLYAAADNGKVYAFNLNSVAPSASANFSVVAHNLEATFSTTAGTGSLYEYNWAFGDGSLGNGMSLAHTYAAAGTYTANLTISNPAGQQMTVTKSVTVHAFTAPRNFTAISGEGNVALSWVAPADNGGSNIINYEIHRAVQGGASSLLVTVSGSNLTFIDASGTAGTNYSYYVVPVNANGAGPASASVSAAPKALPVANDNTVLYVGIAIIVLAVIIAIAMLMLRGRKK